MAERFERFATVECGRSPLYRRLALGLAGDPELLALAESATSGPKPNLLFAAVHYLLLRGAEHGLRSFYPTVAGEGLASGDPFPVFREFCLRFADEVGQLLATRRVQTNEVARACFLYPAFCTVGGLTERPLALVEVGTSAGLLLTWDRYCLDYGALGHGGDPESPVRLECQVRGAVPLGPVPAVASRVGVDLHPIDVRDPDQALWLRALVWGDQPERAERLRQAIAAAGPHVPPLVAGDALAILPGILEGLRGKAVTPVVFHCHTLNQFTPEARGAFAELLARASRGTELYELSLEGVAGAPYPEMQVIRYADAVRADVRLLARYDAHGEWLEWLV